MNPELWQKLDELFHSALEREPGDRRQFLADVCKDDDGLRQELESMLSHHEHAQTFIELPPYAVTETPVSDDDTDSLVGRSFGSYKVLDRLGAGGMGVVYLAIDKKLQRKVALKLLSPEFTGDQHHVKRFKQEARAASALNHPNILTIFEIGEIDGRHFIATEFVEGKTLREVINRGPMAPRETVEVAIQIASALGAAHKAGIVHRDIKPENVMVRSDGYMKLLDFGIAKLSEKVTWLSDASTLLKTEEGTIVGTVPYMSPEQIRALDVDARTDIWSFGVMLYEAIAGCRPFGGGTVHNVIVEVLDSEPQPLSQRNIKVPAELERIIRKALAKERDQRYETIGAMILDLRQLTWDVDAGEPVEPATDKRRNRTALSLVAATVILLLAVGAGLKFWNPFNQTAGTSTARPERLLNYSVTVQRTRNGVFYDQPFQSYGQDSFENGWKFRLNLSSPQTGFLYILGDGPAPNGAVGLTILYPDTSRGNEPIVMASGQTTQTNWYVFNTDSGTEKLWMVWSASFIPEFESVRHFLNSSEKGFISNPSDSVALRQFLVANSAAKPQVEKDVDKKQTVAKVKGDLLVTSLELEHH